MFNAVSKIHEPVEPAEISKEPGQAGDAVPEVSFIVAAYNVAPFIEEAIRSALSQRGTAIEVVVLDDASTDDTASIVERISRGDKRVRLIRSAINRGPSAARNEAIEQARGTWIAILDGDDLVAPDRTRHLLDLASAASADIVADNFERFYAARSTKNQTMMPKAEAPYALVVDAACFMLGNRAFRKGGFSLGAVKIMFRADFPRDKAIRYPEHLDFGEDYHFCLECLLSGARFVVSSETYYKYRMRSGSVSWRMSKAHIRKLIDTHRAVKLSERVLKDRASFAASEAYGASLTRALQFVTIVDLAKQRQWLRAGALAALSPKIWPLVSRFGAEACFKRMRLRPRTINQQA